MLFSIHYIQTNFYNLCAIVLFNSSYLRRLDAIYYLCFLPLDSLCCISLWYHGSEMFHQKNNEAQQSIKLTNKK